MTGAAEPVVVVTSRPLHRRRQVALADVLITGPGRRPAAARCADLFACYPGLAIVAFPAATGAAVAGIRDGTMLRIPGPWRRPAPEVLTIIAVVVYAGWACGIDLGHLFGTRMPPTARPWLPVQVGRWDVVAAGRAGGGGLS